MGLVIRKTNEKLGTFSRTPSSGEGRSWQLLTQSTMTTG